MSSDSDSEEDRPDDEGVAEPAAPPAERREDALPFTVDWPHDAELDRLVRAFERGNYAYVREHASRVAESTQDPKVRAAALDLRRRIDPAPPAAILLFTALGLLLVIGGYYLSHASDGASTKAPAPAPSASP
ncbi:MAG: hypothetical protein U0271_18525 [Polyangiaceae bacterium]